MSHTVGRDKNKQQISIIIIRRFTAQSTQYNHAHIMRNMCFPILCKGNLHITREILYRRETLTYAEGTAPAALPTADKSLLTHLTATLSHTQYGSRDSIHALRRGQSSKYKSNTHSHSITPSQKIHHTQTHSFTTHYGGSEVRKHTHATINNSSYTKLFSLY